MISENHLDKEIAAPEKEELRKTRSFSKPTDIFIEAYLSS